MQLGFGFMVEADNRDEELGGRGKFGEVFELTARLYVERYRALFPIPVLV
jgi:hypothetical protein